MNFMMLILFLPLILGAVVYVYLSVSPRFKMIKSPVFSLVAWLVYLHRRWLIWSVWWLSGNDSWGDHCYYTVIKSARQKDLFHLMRWQVLLPG